MAFLSLRTEVKCQYLKTDYWEEYELVSISFRTGRLERELQMVQLFATRCSCISILWVSLMSFANITFCVASQRVLLLFRYRLSPETSGYTLLLVRRRGWQEAGESYIMRSFHNLHCSGNIIGVMKSWRMAWAGYITCMGKWEMHTEF
jgi:hypothetical protein